MTEEEQLDKELEDLIKVAMDERAAEDASTEQEVSSTDEPAEQATEEIAEKEVAEEEVKQSEDAEEDTTETENVEEAAEDKTKTDFNPIEMKVNGINITINSQEELLEFAQKGVSSLEDKPKIDSDTDKFVNQAKLSSDDLTLLADAKAGDVNAIAKLAKDNNINLNNLTDESANEYQPQFEMTQKTEVDTVAENIMQDTKHAEHFKEVAQTVPSEFKNIISSDAKLLSVFSDQIRSGLAQKIIPEALKSQALQGGNFFDNYVKIGRDIYSSGKEQAKSQPRKMTQEEVKLREQANIEHTKQVPKSKAKTADDIWNMSDEDFNKGEYKHLLK